MEHGAASELLGVYVLDACDDAEADEVRAHVTSCEPCTTEEARLRDAAGWLGVSEAATPSRELRSRVLGDIPDRDDD